ncbi:hypothetical protein C8R31_101681 [Nitrosospira sp. Nsp2]|uniref:DUF7940 domain-containing protein n=1 Tax=Nitrosospira sp. Nsp2 TaxID=136548 RepID=UPI000D30163A|nr:hypothetical protein [Nitrosospira sp. Nsp2]PTR17517.1 hypothetical protein C8R31_101681 [Nitrosospira sp. Nsp2]
MTLIENWKDVLKKAWSVRMTYVTAALESIQQGIKQVPAEWLGLNPDLFAATADICGGLVLVSAGLTVIVRLMEQKNLTVTKND